MIFSKTGWSWKNHSVDISIDEWPMNWRRAFLLGLPLTGPLWLAVVTALCVAAVAFLIISWPIMLIIEIWRKKLHD